MKRRIISLVTIVMLAICMFSANVLATGSSYNTTSRQKIGSKYNNATYSKTVYAKLFPSFGVADLQICNSAGTQILTHDYYPVNPQNPTELTFGCPAHTTRSFYVKSPSGSQVSGDAVYGIR